MLRTQKEELVGKVKADLDRAQTVLFLDYTGLTVEEANRLRRKYQAAAVGYRVLKNALMRRALAGTPGEEAKRWLKGSPTGVVFGFADPVSAARTTFEFLGSCTHLKVKGGLLEKKPITAQEVEALSKMPSLQELQAGLLAAALSPGRRLAAQIKSPASRILGALEAMAKKGEQATT